MKDQNPNLEYYSLPLRPDQTVHPLDGQGESTAAQATPQEPAAAAATSVDPAVQAETAKREVSARHAFSRVGLAVVAELIVWYALTYTLQFSLATIDPALLENTGVLLFTSMLPLILVAEPILYLILRPLPKKTPTLQPPLGGAKVTLLLFMSIGIMVTGALISNVAMGIFTMLTGRELANTVDLITSAPLWTVLLCAVIIGPIFEELVCRKWILTRLLPYGEIPAVLFSSFIFAIMHGNLFQSLYAFGIGVLFSLIYLRTGRLRYCMTLHVLVNALGSLVTIFFLSLMDPEFVRILLEGAVFEDINAYMTLAYQNYIPLLLNFLYSMTEYAAAFAGVILLILYAKKLKFRKNPTDLSLSRASHLAVSSAGGILLLIAAVLFTLLNMDVF